MNLYCVQLLSTLSLSQVREIFLLLNLSLTCIFLFAYHSEKKEKKKYIYIYILCGGPCVHFKTVEPGCEVCHRQEYPSRGSVLEEMHQWSLYEVTREKVTPFSHPHRPSFMERPGGICET